MITQEEREIYTNKVFVNLYKNKEIVKQMKKNKITKGNFNVMISALDESIYKWCVSYLTKKMINDPKNHENIKKLYTKKFFQIYLNLIPNNVTKNDYLIGEILSGNIQIENVVNLNKLELFPKTWEKIIEEKKKIDAIKYSIKEEATTDEYRCKKCKKNRCTYYQRQTRSGDESMTTFITCVECNNKWRI